MQFGHRNEAREKSITDDQFKRFMDAIPFIEEDRYVFFWENIYYCASHLGLRSIETCKIRIEDIDFIDGTLTLPDQKNKVRYEKVIIPDFLLKRLKKHIIKYKTDIIANATGYSVRDLDELKGNYYIFWRMRDRKSRSAVPREKHMATNTIRLHLNKTRNKAGLNQKYGMSKSGHALSVLSYHTLRHYYMQQICDQRGVFAAQISGRHKNLRSTERYLTTSLVAKRDIVNQVFNTAEVNETDQIDSLKEEIAQLKELMLQSVILSNGNPHNVKNTKKMAVNEAEQYAQNRALYGRGQIKKKEAEEVPVDN